MSYHRLKRALIDRLVFITVNDYQYHTLRLHQFEQSMARAVEVYDNAFIESSWSRLEAELVHQRVFHSVPDEREQLVNYIELYRNSIGRPASSTTLVPRL